MKFILFILLCLPAFSQTTKLISPSDLQNWWPMEDGSGSTVTDKVGGGTNGTITGATWDTGIIGNCLNFSGSSQYLDLGTAFRPAVTQPFTIHFWMTDTSGDTTTRVLFAFGNSNCYIRQQSSSFAFRFASGGSSSREAATSSTLADNKWHYIVCVWDGSATASIYVDGSKFSNTTTSGTVGSISYSTHTWVSGINTHANLWKGKVDELKCYYHAATDGEANYLYYCGRQGHR